MNNLSGPLYYRRGGSGPTLVLIHGVVGGSLIWGPVTEALEKHFDVIRIDLLGYANSPKPEIEYSQDTHLKYINETLNNLGVKEPFLIAGLSMGSLLSLRYAKLYPNSVSKIVCVGTPYYRDKVEALKYLRKNFWVNLALIHPLIGEPTIKLGRLLGRHFKFISRLFAADFYTPEMVKESMMGTFYAFKSTLVNCMLNNPTKPLLDGSDYVSRLFIQGSNDKWAELNVFKDGVNSHKNTEIKILEGTGHNTVVLEPKKTAQLMIDFLNE